MNLKQACISTLFLLLMFSSEGFAQDKQLWARSYINKKAPALKLDKWLTEKPDTEGKFIMLDFWATWCGPCKREIPQMNAYSEKFKESLVVIGISAETEEKVKRMTTPKINYYSALDTSKIMNTVYGIQGIPHVVLIDPEGFVRWEGFPTLANHKLTAGVISKIIKDYKTKQ
ncbi:TlpA family protein disulfide reductase [Subsaximicrobium wynnwilliamsii]|nr:TlpA disulfide reductase family protein [Subsaximicrobium wynnwilliamsii]